MSPPELVPNTQGRVDTPWADHPGTEGSRNSFPFEIAQLVDFSGGTLYFSVLDGRLLAEKFP